MNIKNNVLKILFISFLFLIPSCAPVPVQTTTTEREIFSRQFRAPENMSLVYIVRPQRFLGSLANSMIFFGQNTVGSLQWGTYTTIEIPAGKHIIGQQSGMGFNTLEIETQNGRIYFFEVALASATSWYFKQISEEEGRQYIQNCNFVQPLR